MIPDVDEDALWCPYHGILAIGVVLPGEAHARCGFLDCRSLLYWWGTVDFPSGLGNGRLVTAQEIPSEPMPSDLTALVSQALLDAAIEYESQGE